MLQSPTLEKQKKMTSYREDIEGSVEIQAPPIFVGAEKRAHIQIQKGREGEVGSNRMDGD